MAKKETTTQTRPESPGEQIKQSAVLLPFPKCERVHITLPPSLPSPAHPPFPLRFLAYAKLSCLSTQMSSSSLKLEK